MVQRVQNETNEKAELAAILASEPFLRCPILAKLLRYICCKYWEDRTEELKEYNLAVEALGRASDFDPIVNPAVRVEMHRLREKLKKYYETEGLNHPIVITLHPGSYIPAFVRREGLTAAEEDSIHADRDGTPGASHMPQPASAKGGKTVPPYPKDNGHPEILPAVGRKNLRMWVLGWVIAALALSLFSFLVVRKLRSPRSSYAVPTPLQLSTAPTSTGMPGEGPVRIICGYQKNEYIDSGGNVWSGDRYFSGGQAGTSAQRFFYRTRDPTIFDSSRSGDFSYSIPLKPGAYELRLYFAETNFGPDTLAGGGEGSREFTVNLNGKPLLHGFDIFTDAGGNSIADVRVFKDVSPASDGYLHLRFEKSIDEPILNAIEILPSPRGKLDPIRMVAQNNCYTDSLGHVWEPDSYVIGGRLAPRRTQAAGTSDPGLYEGERWGAFNYAIPVAAGRYAITLYFAEQYFGTIAPGGVGSRVFNVYCNDVPLLTNFDIFKEAGGANRALEKTFHGLRPNPQGKLMITFVPVKNYACVNAIQVVDESR